MGCVGFTPDTAFSLMAKKLNFSLIRPEHLPPYILGVSHVPFRKLKTCHFFFFLKVMAFFWPHCHKAQLYGAYDLLSSYLQIPVSDSSSRVTLGLCAASLINALLARSVSFGVRPSLAMFFSFGYDRFYGSPRDHQRF